MSKPRNEVTGRLYVNRKVERTTGCWNCRHYTPACNELDEYRKLTSLDRIHADRVVRLTGGPNPMQLWDDAAKNGMIGKCGVGAVEPTFVHAAFMCDKWSAKTGASLAIGTDRIATLIDEEKDKSN